MNRLTNKAPCAVRVDGLDYPLNTSFRSCLLTALALEDQSLTDWEKAAILLGNLYPGEHPPDLQKAMEAGVKFLLCGQEGNREKGERLCDFAQDGKYIYDALLKQGVDLDKLDDLHWWTFLSYFAEIGESTFSRIVYLRSRKSKGKLTAEERKECSRIGWQVINLDPLSETERAYLDDLIFGDTIVGD